MFFIVSFCMANRFTNERRIVSTTCKFVDDAKRKILGNLVLEFEEIAEAGRGSKDKSNLKIGKIFMRTFFSFFSSCFV